MDAVNSSNERSSKSASDDLICPITHELPFDPVTAEDGRFCERLAIEQHFQTHQSKRIKSPVTNEYMGKRLVSSPQIKSLIETLIENRIIEGDLRDAWKKREAEKQDMEKLLETAANGDGFAMYSVFLCYFRGNHGFPQNDVLAYEWVQKAHKAGSVKATAHLGRFLLTGKVGTYRVPMDKTQGIVLIATAAGQGSNFAAFHLGKAYADGKYGLELDNSQALRWLEQCLSDDCQYKHMTKSYLEKAKTKLEEVLDEDSSDSDCTM